MNKKSSITFGLIGAALFLVSMACQSLFPNVAVSGSTKEKVAKGDVRFEGKGNLSYGDCQDPTAVVSLNIAG